MPRTPGDSVPGSTALRDSWEGLSHEAASPNHAARSSGSQDSDHGAASTVIPVDTATLATSKARLSDVQADDKDPEPTSLASRTLVALAGAEERARLARVLGICDKLAAMRDSDDVTRMKELTAEALNLLAVNGASLFKYLAARGRVSWVEGVFTRLCLHSEGGLELRAHIFHDCNEGYVHNHGFPFHSTCVQGAYLHLLWTVEKGADTYFTRERHEGNRLEEPQRQQGSLQAGFFHEYSAGQAYLIRTHILHTVHPLPSQAGAPVCTLVVRWVTDKAPVHVYSQEKELSFVPPEVAELQPSASQAQAAIATYAAALQEWAGPP